MIETTYCPKCRDLELFLRDSAKVVDDLGKAVIVSVTLACGHPKNLVTTPKETAA